MDDNDRMMITKTHPFNGIRDDFYADVFFTKNLLDNPTSRLLAIEPQTSKNQCGATGIERPCIIVYRVESVPEYALLIDIG